MHLDKANGIDILKRSDYIKSMTELISDRKKLKNLQALQITLYKLNKKNIFSES